MPLAKGGVGITIHIADFGCVTCLGDSPEALWRGLLERRCGFTPVRRFDTRNYVNGLAGMVAALDEVACGERFAALLNVLFPSSLPLPDQTVVLTATSKDNIERLEVSLRKGIPMSDMVPPATLGDLVLGHLGRPYPSWAVNAACASAPAAMIYGMEMIQAGQASAALICGADLVSEFVFSGFSALRAMSDQTARPFDRARNGLILGEAAAYVLLMDDTALTELGYASRAVVRGWGMAGDAHHITAPSPSGAGLKRAIDQALRGAGIEPGRIAAVSAHGTGTVYNDAMEALVYRQSFGEAGGPPLYSIKGALGHTLAPCGLLETIVGVHCLEHKLAPATVNAADPDDRVAGALTLDAVPLGPGALLATNSGFGGINTALLIEGADH